MESAKFVIWKGKYNKYTACIE